MHTLLVGSCWRVLCSLHGTKQLHISGNLPILLFLLCGSEMLWRLVRPVCPWMWSPRFVYDNVRTSFKYMFSFIGGVP